MSKEKFVTKALDDGAGIVKFAPSWVPRTFLPPGGRMKLAPQDLYTLGVERGGFCERWFASAAPADNGPGTPKDEGMSYIVIKEVSKFNEVLFKDAIDCAGETFIGKAMFKKYKGWPIFSKFYDYLYAIPFHLHLKEEHARKVGRQPKPEAYYFPPQLNAIPGRFPYTFFGLNPSTTKADIKRCLQKWNEGDNGVLNYSKAYTITPGTGWVIPAGILHAPGTLVTYEPQWGSDVASMYQSKVEDRLIPWNNVIKDVPKDHQNDLDYIIDLIDWEVNLDQKFKEHHYVEPKLVRNPKEMEKEGYIEKWVTYGTELFSAKELTVFPKKSVKIKDSAAYGLIVVQGHGTLGGFEIESPTMIRYGELTNDELFVTIGAAKEGVKIENKSSNENLVILKHFGPENPDVPK